MTSSCEAPRSLSKLSEIARNNPCKACNYSHKYKPCDCLVKCVGGKYLTLCSGNNTCNHEVYLMGETYTLKEVRLYAPGLHQFQSLQGAGTIWERSDAEVILVHAKNAGGSAENLCVCIPVKKNDITSNKWFSFLSTATTCANLQNIKTGSGWNIENILPPQYSSPYYYYDAGTFPWGDSEANKQCNVGQVHYVVYDMPNSASISKKYFDILSSLIKNNINPITSDNSQVGSKIRAYIPNDSDGGKYMLNCQNTEVDSDSPDGTPSSSSDKEEDTTVFWVVLSIMAAFVIVSMYMVWKKQGRGGAAGAGKVREMMKMRSVR